MRYVQDEFLRVCLSLARLPCPWIRAGPAKVSPLPSLLVVLAVDSQQLYKCCSKGGQAATQRQAHKQRRRGEEEENGAEEKRRGVQIRDAESGQGQGQGQQCSAVLCATIRVYLRSSSAWDQ